MGTFHQGKSDLHGMTVVVETAGPELYVGRCDDMDEERIVLMDADLFRDGESEESRREYLERASRFGVWKKFERLAIPRRRAIAVRLLNEVE